ncbi:NADH:quinone oxidoreductase I, membrane subunit K [Campylobacter iguaniorum]|uniref:NADH-quinone oxidoreductase subunit NuoK n=1 Tax=Campylobacter iguaniorum TaxID=1244531 RepID=UPI0007C8B98E|nr:NADH-quinone oxidoreductase subunit NuoK [Campylobacter iguaniorum]ANE35225.1 NADH:quinone oxidoreductase I, membrane subunit K [Campylobacter iguaniorum]
MLNLYLSVAIILFVIGVVGVLARKNIFSVFMSVELMINAAALVFASFARQNLSFDGHAIVMLIIALAAAEASFGLALIVLLYKQKSSLNIESFNELRDENAN